MDYRVALTEVIKTVLHEAGWTAEDLARRTECPLWKIERWLDGREQPHWAALFALGELRWPLIVEMARLGGFDVSDDGRTITLRRM